MPPMDTASSATAAAATNEHVNLLLLDVVSSTATWVAPRTRMQHRDYERCCRSSSGWHSAKTRSTTRSTGPGKVGGRQCWALDISRRGTDYRPRRGVTPGCDGDRRFYDRRFYGSVAATTVAVPAPPTVTPRRELLRENLRSAHTHNNQR